MGPDPSQLTLNRLSGERFAVSVVGATVEVFSGLLVTEDGTRLACPGRQQATTHAVERL
jgi:hypothetical protein